MEPSASYSNQLIRLRVAGLIENKGSIVLVFDPVYRGGCWILPGGGAEFNETMNQAVEREVFEETGLNVCAQDICALREIWEPEKDLPESQGIRKSVEIFFLCKYISGEINIHNNPSVKWDGIPRVTDCRWVPRSKIYTEIDGFPLYPFEFFEAHLSGRLEKVRLKELLLLSLDLRP